MRTSQEDKGDDEEEMEEIPEFTMKAVQAAIDSLKKGKASDSDGRYQNMRRCDERDHRQIFNEVTRQKDCTREPWRKIKIKVIYKKGHVEEAVNYRPICTSPALYTLVQLVSHVQYCRAKPCRRAEGKEGRTRIVFCLDPITFTLEGAVEAALRLQKGVRKYGPAPRGPLEREAARLLTQMRGK